MLELSPRRTASPQARNARGEQQSRRLLLALVLLLAALAAILIKDRQFWFGSEQLTIEADVPEPTTAQPTPQPATRTAGTATSHTAKKPGQAASNQSAQPTDAPSVAMSRTTLPPLDIEVVAGASHKKLRPASSTTRLEITDSTAAQSATVPPATNAAEREAIVDARPTYPLLAQHMNVQGSVVLQALIGADGVVQNLRVLSGPAILASAAQQAVGEWRFKPIMQNGQAVESKATITVNFTIKVADAAKTTLAESRASDALIITR